MERLEKVDRVYNARCSGKFGYTKFEEMERKNLASYLEGGQHFDEKLYDLFCQKET
ncbi:MAG: hypothetical protein LBS61_05050 [Endomicrobium sp.]|jgi:hypothetical protein|nr:hypothetical protein [Endomicrobium sp.]